MSVAMTARVWALTDPELKDARLLTLLSLADHANGDDDSWPSIPTIAKKTRVSERQVQRCIQWLADQGYIEIANKGNGRGKITVYKLLLKGDIGDKKGDTMTPFSTQKDDVVSPIPANLSPVDSQKGDIQNEKGDIGEPIQSHAQREPIQQPTEETTERAADATTPAPAKRKRSKVAKCPSEPKHPAVIVFHEEQARWPNGKQQAAIANAVTDLELWRLVITKWNLRDYSPVNVDGMLDWYKHPEKIAPRNGANNGSHQRSSATNYQRPPVAQVTTEERLEYNAQRIAEGRPF